jgi:magnesium transporter
MPQKRRRGPGSQSSVHAARSAPLWALASNEGEDTRAIASLDELKAAYARPATRIWVDLEDPDRELLLALASIFELHPLIVEDILERNQRAKIELTGDHLHIVMFGLHHHDSMESHEIDIVLGQRFLLTAHDPALKPREAPFMHRNTGAHLDQGPDYTLWAVADWLVDDYFPVFDSLGDEIDDLEAKIMREPNRTIVEQLFDVRRDLLVIRHAVLPQREIFNQLTNRDVPLIHDDRLIYFRDVYDHLIRLTDELDSYRELVSTSLDIYLSQVNNNLSEIMKRLTGVTVVLTTIAAIGGIFGMSEAGAAFNFTEAAGFWLVTFFSIGLALLVGFYFHRRGWI